MKSLALRLGSILTGLIAVLAAGFVLSGSAMAAADAPTGGGICTSIAGGGTSNFDICDGLTTDNGLPAGGSCSSGVAGDGAGISDADIPAGGDAYDNAAMLWVDSTLVGGVMTVSGQQASFAPVTISGLTIQATFDVLTTEATLRNFVSFDNPSGSPITVQLDYANNFGSDGSTTIKGTSSGDLVFDTGDTWVVTSDATDSDPVNTTVFGDSGTQVPLSGAGTTVFSCAGTEGLLGTFSLTVPASTSVAMVFFHRLSDTTANALAAAPDFDTIPAGSPLLAGLSDAQLEQVVNLGVGGGGTTAPSRATFEVNKDFDDNNSASVEVTISCNTGLPLQQTTEIEEGDGVEFVVVDFNNGEMDCAITEVEPDGYSATYDFSQTSNDTGCVFEDIVHGTGFVCDITNTLQLVDVDVTKVWIDENPEFNPSNVASAEWDCSNVAFGIDDGTLDFSGNPDTESFSVFPDWDGGTTCSVTEVNVPDGGVEVDDSDCQGLVLFPGTGASCTIFNTRLFEGIPTLSQYGLAVLALLLLGVGLIGFRRFV